MLWLAGLCRQVVATGSAQGPAYPGVDGVLSNAQECCWLWDFYRCYFHTIVIHND